MMKPPFLVFAMLMLAGMVLSGESPLLVNQKNEDRTVGFGKSSWEEDHPTYTVQTGYEGYLVPAESLSIKELIKTAGIFGSIPVLGTYAGRILIKVGVAVVGVIIFAALANYALCKVTPLCFINFDAWDRSYSASQDHMQYAERHLATAVDKFDQTHQKSS